jgi:hypothetical protein
MSKYTDHAIDFSFPLVDSRGIEPKTKHRLCLEVGVVANKKHKKRATILAVSRTKKKDATTGP